MASVIEDVFDAGSTIEPSGRPVGNDVQEGEQDPEAIIEKILRVQTLPDEKAREHADRLPPLDLPGFGEPRDDCGVPNPATSYVCHKHGHAHQFNRNCLQYECPMHGKHSIRRRAGGSPDGSGMAPKLEALRKWLDYHRDEHQRFHHLVFSPPDEINVYADDVLKRMFDACRDIMDELGIQGAVVYHSWRHEKEDWENDSMGDWPDVLNAEDWDGAKEQLSFEPHFHVVGIAHEALDYSMTEQIEEETDWVLHRIENEKDNSVSIGGTFEMCKVLLYCLSHAGIYKTEQQKRLAAVLKGPDVNDVQVYTDTALEVEELVQDAAVSTLGIDKTETRCHADVPPDEYHLGHDESLPELMDRVDRRERRVAGESAGLSRPGGPRIDNKYNSRDVYLPGGTRSHHSGVGAMASAPSDLDGGDADDFEEPGGGGTDNTRADTQQYGGGDGGAVPEHPDAGGIDDLERTDVCGSRLLHISQASEYLLSREEWRDRVDDDRLEHLDRLYRDYKRWLEREDLSHADARPMVAEERHGPAGLSDQKPPPAD